MRYRLASDANVTECPSASLTVSHSSFSVPAAETAVTASTSAAAAETADAYSSAVDHPTTSNSSTSSTATMVEEHAETTSNQQAANFIDQLHDSIQLHRKRAQEGLVKQVK